MKWQLGLSVVLLTSLSSHVLCQTRDVAPKSAPSTIAAIRAFDVAIARRAAQLISSPAAWSRDDGTDCQPTATRFSVRCALERASDEAAGRANTIHQAGHAASAPLAICGIQREGSCGPLFEDLPVLYAVAPAKAVTTGVWRTDVHPAAVWAGKMVDAITPAMDEARRMIDSIAPKKYSARLIDYNNDSATTFASIQAFMRSLEARLTHETFAELTDSPDEFELEIYSGGSGVIRTYAGWFAISGFSARDSVLRFQIDTSHQVAPTDVDRAILRRANEILASDSVWNRADNRKCPAGATTWSIYCALRDAQLEVAGGFHHRRPASEIVRVIIEERTRGKKYNHRLMGYNNDPSTRLEDVRSLFAEALTRSK